MIKALETGYYTMMVLGCVAFMAMTSVCCLVIKKIE